MAQKESRFLEWGGVCHCSSEKIRLDILCESSGRGFTRKIDLIFSVNPLAEDSHEKSSLIFFEK